MTEQMTELIGRYEGRRQGGIEQYRLEVFDLATGDPLTQISRSSADIAAVRDGFKVPPSA